MDSKQYLLAYDVGTTGMKTCLFSAGGHLELVASALAKYPLYLFEGGGAEQDPEDWWRAMVTTTGDVISRAAVNPADIKGISFCSQMQGLVLVDREGRPIRNAFSYLDQRATKELKEGMAHGPKIEGANIGKLLVSLAITRAVATSVKDPVWKYHWVRNHEPDAFSRIYKWLDVKEYLIAKLTGSFIMTEDSAFATLLFDTKKRAWSPVMCRMLKVNPDHLPRIIQSTEQAGMLTGTAAGYLGLNAGTPVFGGGGDAASIGIGAGATNPGDTHIYMGTSGWLSTVVEKSMVDPATKTAAIVSALPGRYTYFSELETAGKCLEWVKDHLALDEINLYLEKKLVTDSPEAIAKNLYDYMASVIDTVPPGSNGVIFTPWLHGNRCPFEDSKARGMFFNLSLETGKTEMIRAVTEGVCLHMRWFLEMQEKKIKTSSVIRFVGGGALSPITCQILSDTLGRKIQSIENPQNVGALGAAIIAGLGLGLYQSEKEATDAIPKGRVYEPRIETKKVYDRNYKVYTQLYRSNKKHFAALNA
ncbi:FGGY-family carbohydrate kinase [uncultured Sphaerochaeta sp.]|uniref:xylulokinase n=1 Tax=uncultured Sphaerochaeta sp. TaxID=886478 RepID=UPI0029C9DBF5|nr:FGGY-family carbohydrate kinase [uncultured Sphaerochaeta sp.]